MANTSDRPEGLREALLGGWELSSFDSVDIDTGAVSHPLGTAPRGLILYTADGYMSAQLAGSSDAALPTYIAYGGRFHVDEDTSTVHHVVSVSMLPELLAGPQLRQARVEGDRLTLSASATSDGVTTQNTLVWIRRR
ncbi:lipocalin-like domain-containing protein [Mycolicibacter arupensis]|uniref:lipocalin-like domain-containing protein n=1 Tax=Mycolicibacter arupensis TaxID=342002 RepID=UPI003B3B4777